MPELREKVYFYKSWPVVATSIAQVHVPLIRHPTFPTIRAPMPSSKEHHITMAATIPEFGSRNRLAVLFRSGQAMGIRRFLSRRRPAVGWSSSEPVDCGDDIHFVEAAGGCMRANQPTPGVRRRYIAP